MATVTVSSQDWVLEQLEWHGSGEGHDASCWRRHPHCAEEYVTKLQATIATLDGDLRRLLDGYDFENLVEAEVARRVAAMEPRVVEHKVEVTRRDPKQATVLNAVSTWLEAIEAEEELRRAYGLGDDDAFMHEVPDDYLEAERCADEAAAALQRAAVAYLR